MIRPDIDALGFTIAVCNCDVCGHETTVKAQHNRHRGNANKREVIESQVITKLQGQGWTNIKKTLRCATCEEERKANYNKPKDMENAMAEQPTTTDLRQPTREQKRAIMGLLEEVYDTKAGRYTGGETDKTVAETCGNGVMPGWVSAIREEFFGPDGANEELEVLMADFLEWRDEAANLAKKCHDDIQNALAALRDYNKLRDKLGDMEARIQKLKKAVGPKAEHV
jgi:hypothetical protein